MLGFLQLSLNIIKRHHLLRLLLVEIEDNEIIELCLLVIIDVEFPFFKASEYLFFIDLPVEYFPVSDDGLSEEYLDRGSVFNIFLFISLDGHIER
jgi:hypothetical protein